jgi:hypothetical protein
MNDAPWDASLPLAEQIELMHGADAGYLQILNGGPETGLADQIVEESKWVTSTDGTFQIELRVMRKKGADRVIIIRLSLRSTAHELNHFIPNFRTLSVAAFSKATIGCHPRHGGPGSALPDPHPRRRHGDPDHARQALQHAPSGPREGG